MIKMHRDETYQDRRHSNPEGAWNL